jgi:hypothetical protein
VLAEWRSGERSRAEDMVVDDALSRVPDGRLEAVTAAAASLFEAEPRSDDQRQALASLLAHLGQPAGVTALLDAAERPRLAPHALAALRTLSDPAVLPVLSARVAAAPPAPALADALLQAARGMDAAKARELEQALRPLAAPSQGGD